MAKHMMPGHAKSMADSKMMKGEDMAKMRQVPPAGKSAPTGKAMAASKMPEQAKAYGVRGTKPPSKGK